MERFVAPKEFGVDLREFFEPFPKFLITRHPVLPALPLGGALEKKLQDVARAQTAHQIIERAVSLSLGAGAVGFTASGETLDEGGAQQVRRDDHTPQKSGLALAQGQRRFAAELIYLSQLIG